MLAAPMAMIKIQLKAMKLPSWVSGVTVRQASITEIADGDAAAVGGAHVRPPY